MNLPREWRWREWEGGAVHVVLLASNPTAYRCRDCGTIHVHGPMTTECGLVVPLPLYDVRDAVTCFACLNADWLDQLGDKLEAPEGVASVGGARSGRQETSGAA